MKTFLLFRDHKIHIPPKVRLCHSGSVKSMAKKSWVLVFFNINREMKYINFKKINNTQFINNTESYS